MTLAKKVLNNLPVQCSSRQTLPIFTCHSGIERDRQHIKISWKSEEITGNECVQKAYLKTPQKWIHIVNIEKLVMEFKTKKLSGSLRLQNVGYVLHSVKPAAPATYTWNSLRQIAAV